MGNKKHIRIFSLVVFVLVIGSSSWAQSGYKDLLWGMTQNQVQAKVADLVNVQKVFFPIPSRAFFALHSNEITSTIPNLLEYVKGAITYYKSDAQDTDYFFLDGKLLAVQVSFIGENIRESLEAKYGYAPISTGKYISYTYSVSAWAKDPKRLIYWEDTNWGMEYVAYVDGEWFSKIEKVALADYRAQKAETSSKLD